TPAFTIIDAKDYRVINGSLLLGSAADHYKQIVYRALLEGRTSGQPINILAFPSIGQTSLFVLRGCHYWSMIRQSTVFEVLVDYELAIKHWLGEATIPVEAAFQTLLTNIADLTASIGPKDPDFVA